MLEDEKIERDGNGEKLRLWCRGGVGFCDYEQNLRLASSEYSRTLNRCALCVPRGMIQMLPGPNITRESERELFVPLKIGTNVAWKRPVSVLFDARVDITN